MCFGEATKFSRYLLDADKVYEATMQLGVTTNTADAEGEVLETKEVNVSAADIEAVLPTVSRRELSKSLPCIRR